MTTPPPQPQDFENAGVVVLDLGGVILEVDYQKTLRAFKELGLNNAGEIYSQNAQQQLFDLLERGEISSAEFLDNLSNQFKEDVDSERLVTAWCAMLGRIPETRMQAVEKLARRCPLYLLSNTNAIHKEAFYGTIRATVGIERFESAFRKIYFSHETGMRKPEARVFEFVGSQINVPAGEILFIDDTERHVQGALKAGWKGRLLPKEQGIANLIQPMGE